jgi:hypothetical protein
METKPNQNIQHWWSSDPIRGVGFGKIFFKIDKSGFAWSLFFLNHFSFWKTVFLNKNHAVIKTLSFQETSK